MSIFDEHEGWRCGNQLAVAPSSQDNVRLTSRD